MIITIYQKEKLEKWKRGEIKTTDLYLFLASRVNEIPSGLSDEESILYCIENSILNVDCF